MACKPLVSIGIPTYNDGLFLREAVFSALTQSYRRIEVVVCDNASTDDTEEIIRKIDDPRLRYIRNNTNLGMVNNFRRVLSKSKGKYICFLGSDDLLEPEFVSWTVNVLETHHQCVFAFTGVRLFGTRQGEVVWDLPAIIQGKEYIMKSLNRARNLTFLSGALVRRDLVENVGIEDLVFFDWTLWLRLASHRNVAYTPKILAHHRYHDTNETNLSISRYSMHLEELSDSILTYLDREKPDMDLLSSAYGCLGKLFYIYTNHLSRAKNITWRAFFKDLAACWSVPAALHLKLKYSVRSIWLRGQSSLG